MYIYAQVQSVQCVAIYLYIYVVILLAIALGSLYIFTLIVSPLHVHALMYKVALHPHMQPMYVWHFTLMNIIKYTDNIHYLV